MKFVALFRALPRKRKFPKRKTKKKGAGRRGWVLVFFRRVFFFAYQEGLEAATGVESATQSQQAARGWVSLQCAREIAARYVA